jgi:protein-S-isoprenylcysteine O-methyltransferase Ste14
MLEDIKKGFLSKGKPAVIFAVALVLLSVFAPQFITQVEKFEGVDAIDAGSYSAIPVFIMLFLLFFYLIAMILCFIVALAYLTDFLDFEKED